MLDRVFAVAKPIAYKQMVKRFHEIKIFFWVFLVDDQEDVQPEIGGPLLLHYFSCANYAAMVRHLVITLWNALNFSIKTYNT